MTTLPTGQIPSVPLRKSAEPKKLMDDAMHVIEGGAYLRAKNCCSHYHPAARESSIGYMNNLCWILACERAEPAWDYVKVYTVYTTFWTGKVRIGGFLRNLGVREGSACRFSCFCTWLFLLTLVNGHLLTLSK